jgi:hypothetical protein
MKYFTNLLAIKEFISINYNIINNSTFNKENKSISNFCEFYNPKNNYKIYTLDSDDKNIFLRIEKRKEVKENTNFLDIFLSYIYPEFKFYPIGSIDIFKNDIDKKLIIKWFLINDELFARTHNYMYKLPLDYIDTKLIKDIIFNYAFNVAKINNYEKIELDVHRNLTYYNEYNLKDYGFVLTNKRALDNHNWIITEKKL